MPRSMFSSEAARCRWRSRRCQAGQFPRMPRSSSSSTTWCQAPNFQQSWDQALSPAQAEALLNNIDQLFLLKITPEQFATAMNATIEE